MAMTGRRKYGAGSVVHATLIAADPDTEAWNLAVRVLEGGPLRIRNAVELAGAVLESADSFISDDAPVRARMGKGES